MKSKNEKYNYIITNYDKYNLELTNEYDMLMLLNKLEAYGETLDSLHDLDGNMDGFCDLVVTNNSLYTDSEVANAVMECNAFYESKEQYLKYTEEEGEDLEFLSELWDNQLEDGTIVKTTDGYVELAIV